MIVGILFPYYWKKKTDVNLMFFLYGIIMWFIVVFIKSLIDFGVLSVFGNLFNPLGAGILITCVYVGLKTGLLESGLSYVFVLKKKLKMDFDRAVAFGLGFGCIEA
ncbi:MAG: YhfC family intramembrane metalloprotease, partial [Candidatus Aenigmatarchaeota archaeon]